MGYEPIKDPPVLPHIETRQLTGFYVRATLTLNELRTYQRSIIEFFLQQQ